MMETRSIIPDYKKRNLLTAQSAASISKDSVDRVALDKVLPAVQEILAAVEAAARLGETTLTIRELDSLNLGSTITEYLHGEAVTYPTEDVSQVLVELDSLGYKTQLVNFGAGDNKLEVYW